MFIHMFICMSQRFNVQSIYCFSENLAKDAGRMYASGLLRVVKCLIIVNAHCTAGKSPTNRYIGNSGPWLIVARPIDSCMIIPSHSHSSHIICQSFSHPKPLKHSWNLKLGRIIRVTEKKLWTTDGRGPRRRYREATDSMFFAAKAYYMQICTTVHCRLWNLQKFLRQASVKIFHNNVLCAHELHSWFQSFDDGS